MKRFLTLVFTLLLVLSFFAVPGASAAQPIELDMYFPVSVGGGPDQLISALCRQFHEENPDIIVNPVYAGTYAETRTKVQAALKSGNTPAIALMFSIDLFSLLSMDALYDYDQFCATEADQAWLNGFYDGFMENSRTGGKTYGIPWQRSTIILYYNKDAFREVGLDPETPPATWQELEDYASKLTKVDSGATTRYGIQIPSDKAGYAYWMLQTFCTQQNGFNLMNDAGTEVYFNDPRTIKGLTFWKGLSDKGYQVPGTAAWSTTVTDFLEQRAAMVYHTTGNLTNVRKNASFEFGTAMLPADESRGSPTGGGNFYLFKGVPEEQTRAAFRFIQWMTNDPDRVAQWSMDTGYVATRPAAYETDRLKAYAAEFPHALTARDQLPYAHAEFSVYDQGMVQDALDTAIEAVMTGAASPEEAMGQAQQIADGVLAAYK
ncbi:MAG: ABC transporter substrate-binding protein [Christensenellaceae bacterium]|nr:ABC transporter substrate-binding protein [Christensenellaceae bacterium]MEA5069962.1 ABC transporter substrate-binding protein [Christensenellaceae bacterium]